MKRWLINVLIAVDQLANAIMGGWPDETLSARSHRKRDGWREVINAVFFWQDDHCRDAFYGELKRRQLPPEYRDA